MLMKIVKILLAASVNVSKDIPNYANTMKAMEGVNLILVLLIMKITQKLLMKWMERKLRISMIKLVFLIMK